MIEFSEYQSWNGVMPIFADEQLDGWEQSFNNSCATWENPHFIIIRQKQHFGSAEPRKYNAYRKVGEGTYTSIKHKDITKVYDSLAEAAKDCN